MTQNKGDTAPDRRTRKSDSGKNENAARSGERSVNARQVADYLRRHPDFLARHPDLLDSLHAPGRVQGKGVVDLQTFMIERLRQEVIRLTGARDELVTHARDNLTVQNRIHRAVIALLEARSFEHFIETATTDLAVILDVDVVTIGVEQDWQDRTKVPVRGVTRLVPGFVDDLLGPGGKLMLRDDIHGDAEVFGAGAGLVRSEALIRLSISPAAPKALLAFGSREPDHFHAGQGTELLSFLGQVVENSIRAWLDLPS